MFYTQLTGNSHSEDQLPSDNRQFKHPSIFDMCLKTDMSPSYRYWGCIKFPVDIRLFII